MSPCSTLETVRRAAKAGSGMVRAPESRATGQADGTARANNVALALRTRPGNHVECANSEARLASATKTCWHTYDGLKFLDFEQPIAELEAKIEELRFVGDDSEININEEVARLRE